jgi:hypothetical protein
VLFKIYFRFTTVFAMTRRVLPLVLLLTACPADPSSPEVEDESDDAANEEGSGGSTSGVGSMSSQGEASTSTGAEDSGEEGETGQITTQGFLADMGNDAVLECSVWEQDCMEGEKCMPWSNNGEPTWNATKCVEMDPEAGQVGDPCTVEGSGVSGVDTCTAASMCWNVDPETNQGTCIAFCAGSENNPICDDPSTTCSITNDGVLILCLPNCDPLLQECDDGEACYGIIDGYVCAPDVSGEMGAFGDPCEAINVCDPGLECMPAAGVPDCPGAMGCCTEFCDLSNPNASDECAGSSGGQMCLGAFEQGDAPPGYEDVGYCLVPT